MISVDDAQARVLASFRLPSPASVSVENAFGLSLREPVHAKLTVPGAPVSVMDGYAVRSDDLVAELSQICLHVRSESAAGHPSSVTIAPGVATRISTGAVLPPGSDLVVAQEDTVRSGEQLLFRDTLKPHQRRAGSFVRPEGSDFSVGDILLHAGRQLHSGDLALIAGSGNWECMVTPRPKVTLVCTGDELVPVGTMPKIGQLVNTNALMLASQIRDCGAMVESVSVAPDRPDDLKQVLESSLHSDMLITSGGISVGDHDLVRSTVDELGFVPEFSKVNMRPGKPTTFGHTQGVPTMCLPGNPASCYVAFELFVRPLLLCMQGRDSMSGRAWRKLRLSSDMEGPGQRVHFARATVEGDTATPLGVQQSGALRSISSHTALLRINPGSEPTAAGERVDALIIQGNHYVG